MPGTGPGGTEEPLLQVTDLSVSFGGVAALSAVSFGLVPGQLTGLIGPNGAGKTTTIDAVSGFVPHRGRIRFRGTEVSGLTPHRRARLGMTRTWQSLELFDDLTVEENLLVAAHDPDRFELARDAVHPRRHPPHDAIGDALELVGLTAARDRLPTELSLGQRKLAAVARAIAAGPALLLLDEPAAGLDSTESRELGHRLRGLTDHGITILLVDHDMGLVLEVCDHLLVLDFGRLIAEGPPGAVRSDAAVIEAYLGVTHGAGAGG